jgi:hypothetical protein
MSYIVVGYFTVDTIYETEVRRLIASMMRFNIPYFIKPIADLGSWYFNTQYKPIFLQEMMGRFPDRSLVYVDVDAEFCRPPDLFDSLDARPDVNISVHILDHKKRGHPARSFEMLSGTIYLKNNQIVRDLMYKWEVLCRKGGKLWDQTALAAVLKDQAYQILPEEYCMIYDYMSDVKEPVIKHYQASRQISNKDGKLPLPTYEVSETSTSSVPRVPAHNPPKPRRVDRGSIVRHPRKWRNQ